MTRSTTSSGERSKGPQRGYGGRTGRRIRRPTEVISGVVAPASSPVWLETVEQQQECV